jgi:glycosyltransferase involved in cell wall biosynthesis
MLTLLTDFSNAPGQLEVEPGRRARAVKARSLAEFVRRLRGADAVVVNGTLPIVYGLAALFTLVPLVRKPLVAVDLVLRPPRTKRQKALLPLKRFLLSKVDHFIHFFRDLSGYERHYGIGPDRSSYVPFKVNISGQPLPAPSVGRYVLAIGTSQRDYDTFIAAIERSGHPAVMTEYSFTHVEERSVALTVPRERLPANLTLVADDGSREALVATLVGARLVVIPTLRDNICASGIGTYLDAMYLGKCVIMSHGPGASDVMQDEAIFVAPGDPEKLREAIARAWEDGAYRAGFEARGRRYATSLGGEAELIERVLSRTVSWLHEESGKLQRA